MFLFVILQHEKEDGIPVQIGNKTDCALLQYLAEFGEYYESWRDDYPEDKLVKVYEFTPDRKCMTTIIENEQGGFKLYTKGAAEILLEQCTSVVGMEGQLREFTKEEAEDLSRDLIELWQQEGLRILCLATKDILANGELHCYDAYMKVGNILFPLMGDAESEVFPIKTANKQIVMNNSFIEFYTNLSMFLVNWVMLQL